MISWVSDSTNSIVGLEERRREEVKYVLTGALSDEQGLPLTVRDDPKPKKSLPAPGAAAPFLAAGAGGCADLGGGAALRRV